MRNLIIALFILVLSGCTTERSTNSSDNWTISVLPSSIRLDPVSNEAIDHRFVLLKGSKSGNGNILEKNQVYDGAKASLAGARGEYVSFQLVLTNNTNSTLKNIIVDLPAFRKDDFSLPIEPELFLEWSVNVKSPSTGYPESSLGTGWYPDALIPFSYIQMDSARVKRRWTYPLWLPDFNNRIENQKSLIVWVDQYIPFNAEDAKSGTYSSSISVTIDGVKREIPVELKVWNFAIPNENKFKACLQHEGFLKYMTEEQELEISQLMKRNRIGLLDPTYDPEIKITPDRKVEINWKPLDDRLVKYFTGKAFTSEYGYNYGPGYGEPIETFGLPFDVYGKHHTPGWPDIGKPEVERNPENQAVYLDAINKVRKHYESIIDPDKTDITVYLNGLDESYFPEAWARMVYFGDIFRKHYPEARFRIDGGYSEEALQIVKNSIDSWASHTIEYDYETVKKYQEMGIRVWLYGPMLYESKVNSWVGSSTFIDLPLVNDRAISWSCWKYKVYSWLSWGAGAGWVNGWYDPESWKDASKERAESDAEFTYKKLNGNALLIYSPGVVPNVDGACPSIRLKTMRNGVQEYEYMRLLAEVDKSNARADSIVNSIIGLPFGPKAIGNKEIWSYDEQKWDESRIRMGEMIDQAMKNN